MASERSVAEEGEPRLRGPGLRRVYSRESVEGLVNKTVLPGTLDVKSAV